MNHRVMFEKILIALPVILFAALLLLIGGIVLTQPPQKPAMVPLVGAPAPTLDGLIPGRITAVNVFASWCGPCEAEHPMLVTLKKENPDVFMIGLNYRDDDVDAAAYLKRLSDPYDRIIADKSGQTALAWGMIGLPALFIIGRDGYVRYRLDGPLTAEILAADVGPLLKKLKK